MNTFSRHVQHFVLRALVVGITFLFINAHGLNGQYLMTDKPRLVVGVVVDQMRYDYITRYWEKYGDHGFKRLINQGYFFENAHYEYAPTYTAPGHATIYTGCSPAVHGIIGNNWYDKTRKEVVYCTQDTSVQTLGATGNAGLMSPKNLLVSTLADQIKLATNFKSKSVGVSIKDRGAILPAGHAADIAFWFDSRSGHWITSTHYTDQLPEWVANYNRMEQVDSFLNQAWTTLLPIEEYTESIEDLNPFEKPYLLGTKPIFPYDLAELRQRIGPGLIRATPFGNTMTADFAKKAIIEEGLGSDDDTDFLAVSFSSTDYIGHQFGPRSIEVEDTYLRLDQDLADLLVFLDNHVGDNAYTLFLSADHGAVETPLFLENFNIPAGYFQIEQFKSGLAQHLNGLFGKNEWIENISNDQVFLNNQLIKDKKVDRSNLIEAVIDFSIRFDGVQEALSGKDLRNGNFNNHQLELLQRGFHHKRSGDVIVLLEPGWITYFRQGTTHGSPYSYDTHVPLLFFGQNIKHGASFTPVRISDIAPTVAALLHIQPPNGTTGKVITELFNN